VVALKQKRTILPAILGGGPAHRGARPCVLRSRGGQLHLFAEVDWRITSGYCLHVIRLPENYGLLSLLPINRPPSSIS
jgi:hypothetical protein